MSTRFVSLIFITVGWAIFILVFALIFSDLPSTQSVDGPFILFIVEAFKDLGIKKVFLLVPLGISLVSLSIFEREVQNLIDSSTKN